VVAGGRLSSSVSSSSPVVAAVRLALARSLRLAALARYILSPFNAEVSDGSQPPMTFDLSLGESAGSRSLNRLVCA